MFENYLYIDRNKIIEYISEIRNLKDKPRLKDKKISLELKLPFITIKSDFTFSKEITELSDKQLCLIFEGLMEKFKGDYFVDLDEKKDDDYSYYNKNLFIKKTGIFHVPDTAEKLNAVKSLNNMSDLVKSELKNVIDTKQKEMIMKVIQTQSALVPLVNKDRKVSFYFLINDTKDEIIEALESEIVIVGKIKKNTPDKAKIYDIGKELLALNPSLRRQIHDYDKIKDLNISVESQSNLEIEVLYIIEI